MASIPANMDAPAGKATLRTDTLADSILILLSLTVVQRLVGFGRSILFCRWLDPQQLGQWDMAFSFLMLAAPLCVLSLSGSFGRYVEHYRQRRHLQALLRRTAILCACLAIPAAFVICAARRWFSQLIFGTPEQTELVVLLVASLLAVIVMNYFMDLLNALRNARLIAAVQLFNSVAFAALAIGLLARWQCSAVSVVLAYGGACALSSTGVLLWLRRAWGAFPDKAQRLPHRDLWSKVIPFVSWMVITSLLANLFDVVDRYMIVHYSRMPAAEALAWVGDYFSSRVIPSLFVSIAIVLGAVIMPHLSSDWEAGRRDRVRARLALFMKLFGFALSAAAVAVLFAAPLLFNVAFRGKFASGLAVLPWTLTYCSWFALALIAQNYLWCSEKARLSSLAILLGLLANVGLNLLLLPRMGLLGAVLATTSANLIMLVLICTFNHLLGFRMDRGTRVILALPLVVCLGPWLATLVLVAVALEMIASNRLLSAEEKQQLVEGWSEYLERFRSLLANRRPAEGSSH